MGGFIYLFTMQYNCFIYKKTKKSFDFVDDDDDDYFYVFIRKNDF